MDILLMEGVGFAEQSPFHTELTLQEVSSQIFDIDQPFEASFVELAEKSKFVIFRSRWAATAEENLFTRMLVKKHLAYFDLLHELMLKGKIKVVAVGRGALLWLEWMRVRDMLGSPIRWKPETLPSSSWIETQVFTQHKTTIAMRSLVSGRALIYGLNLGGAKVTPWVEYHSNPVGWIVNDNLYLSIVDVFALSERAQLSDYGYEDLSSVSTRSNLIQMLLAGEM